MSASRSGRPMVIECHACPVRGLRCDDCLVTAMARLPAVQRPTVQLTGGELPLDAAERCAVQVFVAAGLVSADVASGLRARPEPFDAARGVG